jgi:pimeloyl-ACP methyl ester carboxylesterase
LLDLLAPFLERPFFVAYPCWFDAPANRSAECDYLYVSARRTPKPQGTIRLPVAILRAESKSEKTPVIFLPGGPRSALGAPRFTTSIWESELERRPWLRDRDLILFDYRGTYNAKPSLACADVRHYWLSWLEHDEFLKRFTWCTESLEAMGYGLRKYDTHNIMLDAYELVHRLGLGKINIWSQSYGTRVAFEWMRKHPEQLRAVIMYGPFPPEISDWRYSHPKNLYRTLTKVFALCARDERCRTKHPALESSFHEALASLRDSPLAVHMTEGDLGVRSLGFPTDIQLDDAMFVGIVSRLAVTWNGIRKIPMLIGAALRRDEEPFARLLGQDITTYELEFIDPVQFNLVYCNDSGPNDSKRWAKETEGVRFFGKWLDGEDICTHLPYDVRPTLPQERVISDVPALLVVGAFDSITPPEWAKSAGEGLSRGQVYVLPFRSHLVDSTLCSASMTESFLEDPEANVYHKCADEANHLTSGYELFPERSER